MAKAITDQQYLLSTGRDILSLLARTVVSRASVTRDGRAIRITPDADGSDLLRIPRIRDEIESAARHAFGHRVTVTIADQGGRA